MDEMERIKSGDHLFGIGLLITDYLSDELFNGEKYNNIIIKPLKEDEEADYGEKMEEIRVICENEEFILTCSKHYLPYSKRNNERFFAFDDEEMVLVKEIDLSDDAPDLEDSVKLGKTFKDISKYLDLPIKELCFFFYFPEKIMIDKGVPYVSIVHQSEWEHKEEFGDH